VEFSRKAVNKQGMFEARRQKVEVLAKGDLYASFTHLYDKGDDIQGIFHNTIYANATCPQHNSNS
jgi:hypothetical protein